MRLLFTKWMAEIDRLAIREYKIPSLLLMENAAQKTAQICEKEFPAAQFRNVIIIAGKGNNGGDGIALARILSFKNYKVTLLVLAAPKELAPDARKNLLIAKKCLPGFQRIKSVDQLRKILKRFSVSDSFIVDAVFGTGLQSEVKPGFYQEIIQAINNSGYKVLAIDVPSGMGEGFVPDLTRTVKADITVTFHLPKWAHFAPDGNNFVGRLYVADISIPPFLKAEEEFCFEAINPQSLHHLFKRREAADHKGKFGHLLSVAGSWQKPGAGLLVAQAAIASGAGLVTCAIPEKVGPFYINRKPELMLLYYHNFSELQAKLSDYSVVVAGPGLSVSKETAELIAKLIGFYEQTLILDADALNVLQTQRDILKKTQARIILTPHPLEFSRISGISVQDLVKNRILYAREFALQNSVYLVLKGHHSVVATPDGAVAVNFSGNPGMATAGSGDVLSGIIGGLFAQLQERFVPEEILKLAVFLHGYSGDLALKLKTEWSLNASDLIEFLPQAINSYESFQLPFQIC